MRTALAMAAVAALYLTAVPITARAQVSAVGLDRPDLLDAIDRFKPEPGDEGGAGTASYADVFFGNENSGFAFFGGARGRLSGPDVELVWFLFEPDKVSRSGTKITLSQKSQVGIAVPGALDQAQPVEGCKAKVSLKGGPPPLVPESAKWSFQCKKDALDDIEELSSQQKEQLAVLFGSQKLKLKNDGPRCGSVPNCGDGIVDCDETCDDGNAIEDDGCTSACLPSPVCGDGLVQVGEECDDGNTLAGDGCSPICQAETNCGDGNLQTEEGEQCDDGNTADGDGCDSICLLEECGNGILQEGAGEECDDGNTVPDDGCDENCGVEA
jgi:cysteine-rich repeat protein